MIGEAVVLEQRGERAGAAPEAERVDRQHRELGSDVVAAIAGGLVLPRERFAHDHPQRVAGRGAVARGQHELVAIRMLGTSIVVVQPAAVATGEMRDDVERRVGQGPAEMSGLRVVAEQHQRHAGHEADVLELLQIADVERDLGSRGMAVGFALILGANSTLRDRRTSRAERQADCTQGAYTVETACVGPSALSLPKKKLAMRAFVKRPLALRRHRPRSRIFRPNACPIRFRCRRRFGRSARGGRGRRAARAEGNERRGRSRGNHDCGAETQPLPARDGACPRGDRRALQRAE